MVNEPFLDLFDEFDMPDLPDTGSKRTRRMRSVQGQAGGNDLKKGKGRSNSGRSVFDISRRTDEFLQLEKSGAPPFLIKTYQLITTCDNSLAQWSEDGDTFVIKNADRFAKEEIPKYFEHSNFSSFSRQLNFYGFKKVPQKAVRIDQKTDEQNYVRFFNEKFKRGRIDLLSQIQRSTKTGGSTANQAQEVKALKDRIASLETQLSNMQYDFEALQNQVKSLVYQQQQASSNNNTSIGNRSSAKSPPYPTPMNVPNGHASSAGMNVHAQVYHPSPGHTYSTGPQSHAPLPPPVASSSASSYGMQPSRTDPYYSSTGSDGYTKYPSATLEPHPKTKHIDPSNMPPPPPGVRGVSRGVSLLRGLSSGFDGELFNAVMSDEGPLSSPSSPHAHDKMYSSYASAVTADPSLESSMVRMNSLNLSDNFQRDEKVLGI